MLPCLLMTQVSGGLRSGLRCLPRKSPVFQNVFGTQTASLDHRTGRGLSSTCATQFEVINVQDEEDFKKRVIDVSSSKPVVVDFHATWCGPCKLLGPRLETILAQEKGKVVFAKVDIDDNSDLAVQYGVRSVPTVIGVKNGKVQSQFVGLVDDDQIRSFVAKLTMC